MILLWMFPGPWILCVAGLQGALQTSRVVGQLLPPNVVPFRSRSRLRDAIDPDHDAVILPFRRAGAA